MKILGRSSRPFPQDAPSFGAPFVGANNFGYAAAYNFNGAYGVGGAFNPLNFNDGFGFGGANNPYNFNGGNNPYNFNGFLGGYSLGVAYGLGNAYSLGMANNWSMPAYQGLGLGISGTGSRSFALQPIYNLSPSALDFPSALSAKARTKARTASVATEPKTK